jgi:hypothetical protein
MIRTSSRALRTVVAVAIGAVAGVGYAFASQSLGSG